MTATLKRDVSETIQIDSDGITLNGNGHTVLGDGSGMGIYIDPNAMGDTIKNLVISGFAFGFNVFVNTSNQGGHVFTNNTITHNTIGFFTGFCQARVIVKNNSFFNNDTGIFTDSASWNIFSENKVYGNNLGIRIEYNSHDNKITDNIIHNNSNIGILLFNCQKDTVTHNYIHDNNNGIVLMNWSNDHTITRNTIYHNRSGLLMHWTPDDKIFNNNFINNMTQVYDQCYTWNEGGLSIFFLQPPVGGNYWSNWTTPNVNSDGFVDVPYEVFSCAPENDIFYQDDYPWVIPNGWLTPLCQFREIFIFFNISADEGNVTGIGSGLNIMRNMLSRAGMFIERGNFRAACRQLKSVYERTDGNIRPPDYVRGEAVKQLALMIQGLRTSLRCVNN